MEKQQQGARLRQGFFLVLIIMVTMTTLSSVIAISLIFEQEYDSRNINISGMQRMLSQKIALHAEQIQHLDATQAEYARKRMFASAIRFLENHKLLTSHETNPNLSKAIAEQYFKPEHNLDKVFRDFANNAISYSNAAEFEQDWQYNSQEIEQILLKLDFLVSLYEEAANKNVGNIFFIELVIWLINLIIILCAYFILIKRSGFNNRELAPQ